MLTKLTKRLQMIIITLILIVIGTIIVWNLSSNNVIAYSEGERCNVCYMTTLKRTYNSQIHGYYCDYCKDWYGEKSHNNVAVDYIKTEIYMRHTTYYLCRDCHYKTQKMEKCNLINFKSINQNEHEAKCKQCQDIYILNHVDKNKNGICDDCSAKITQNTPDNHICLDNSEYKIVVFDYAYHDYYAICNLCENPVPDWQKREKHNFGEYNSKGEDGHSTICKTCGYELIQEHEGATHKNEGKCTICNYQYETHKKSTTISGYTNINNTTHTTEYKCSHEGCTETFTGNVENHNYQNGICSCGYKKAEEEIKITSKQYKINDKYILNVQPKTSTKEFKANIETNGLEINLYNNNIILKDSDIVVTGTKLEIKIGNNIKIFIIIVKGDVNEDGKADFKDIITINKARINKIELEEKHIMAGDVTNDKKIDFYDIIKINKYRLNKITKL